MMPPRYPGINDFPHRVEIDNRSEWLHHHEMSRWCMDNLGWEGHCLTWRHALSGSPSRADPLFSTWLFMREEDAVLFRMVWG